MTEGELVLTFKPRRGAAPIEARRVGRGHLVGEFELLTKDRSDKGAPAVLPRLHSAHCGSAGGCKLLAVRRELFSHLSDVFEPLSEELMTRADAHLEAT